MDTKGKLSPIFCTISVKTAAKVFSTINNVILIKLCSQIAKQHYTKGIQVNSFQ